MSRCLKERMRGSKKWFFVDLKSFEVLVEGEGRFVKGFITERRKGLVSWIRFGGEGLRTLVKSIEIYCNEGVHIKRTFEWRENGRFYKMESHRNDAGNYMSCLVTDGEGKRHKIFIPEGRGLIKGWVVLADKLREFGIKGKLDERKNKGETKEMDEHVEGERKRSFPQGKSFVEIMKDERWKN